MQFRVLMLFGLVFCSACASTTATSDTKTVTGYIRFYPIEGGFYALRGDDSVTYDPTNLAKDLQNDGMLFWARLNVKSGAASIHMVGPVVDIVEIAVPRTASVTP